jgi:tRNA uridine 5-carbamoylmethylation protein Kti12
MGQPDQGMIVLVTGPPGAGKSTVVRAACELIASRTQQQTIQLEFDDLIVGVIDPSAYLTPRREQAGLEMTVTAALTGARHSSWLVLEGCFNRRRLEHLRAHLPVAATYGLSAPLDTCWERNEGRDAIIRLSKDEFDQLLERLDVRPGDDLSEISWLDTTLPVETLANQLATELIELAGTPVA